MGGKPTISGGMTQAEYNEMLNKQAQIAADAEKTRAQNLRLYEEQRIANEKEQLRLQKESERLAVASQQAAEQEVAKEIQSKGSTSDASNLSEEEKQKLQSMFSSLYSSSMDQYLKRPQG